MQVTIGHINMGVKKFSGKSASALFFIAHFDKNGHFFSCQILVHFLLGTPTLKFLNNFFCALYVPWNYFFFHVPIFFSWASYCWPSIVALFVCWSVSNFSFLKKIDGFSVCPFFAHLYFLTNLPYMRTRKVFLKIKRYLPLFFLVYFNFVKTLHYLSFIHAVITAEDPYPSAK